jgi:hypothetical protein
MMHGHYITIALRNAAYLSAGLFAIVIAWMTTGFQSIKSAVANPADALRGE